MLQVTVELEGKTWSDIRDAIEEVRRLLGEEYLIGLNYNDTGCFRFYVTGEEEEIEDDQDGL